MICVVMVVASADWQTVSSPAGGLNDMDRAQAEPQRALAAGREGSGRRTLAETRLEK